MFHLKRWAKTPDGTLGRLDTVWGLHTMEEEDQGNRQNVSRIPAGRYTCARRWYIRGRYWTFEIMNVPDRTDILFHRGNTEEDTEGCVLLGSEVGVMKVTDEDSGEPKHKLAVRNSRKAFDRFMNSLREVDSFELLIEDED